MEEDRIKKLGLPQDVILKVPYLYFSGNRNLVIENHRGIITYHLDCIIIRCAKYKIIINGCSLEIESYSSEEIIIHGNIGAVQFVYE